jgi:hypothetical protein
MLLPVVFAGISLSRVEAERMAIEFRPPIKRGDLDQLSDNRTIAIIDGELDEASVLSNDEIMRALRRGMKISGAASVGAMRACERRADGMIGHGWVYEAYCQRRITGPDEIEVLYDPYLYRQLTIPLVNVRFCLEMIISQRGITPDEVDYVMASIRKLSLKERDRRNILLHMTRVFGRERVKQILKSVKPAEIDIKRRDAKQLLCTLKS